jgi:hypothetical protein
MPHPSHSPWFDHPPKFGEAYKLWSSSLHSLLQLPATSSLLGPNILLRNLFSYLAHLCSSLSVSDQVPYPYRTWGKIIVMCIWILKF